MNQKETFFTTLSLVVVLRKLSSLVQTYKVATRAQDACQTLPFKVWSMYETYFGPFSVQNI